MNSTFKIFVTFIVVLLLIGTAVFFFNKDTVNTGVPAEYAEAFEAQWPALQQTITLKPTLGATQWFLTDLKEEDLKNLRATFEDGHIESCAIFSAEKTESAFIFKFVEIPKDCQQDVPDENSIAVKIAELTERSAGDDYSSGCYNITFKEVQIPKTTSILDGTLKYFFDEIVPEQMDPDFKEMKYGQTTIKDELARIYLTGKYSQPDTCPERYLTQLAETALQFNSVKDVEVYINGNPQIWWYMGDMRGDILPKLSELVEKEAVPALHAGKEYENVELKYHRYYKKGFVAEITYTGLHDDSTEAVKYEAKVTNTFSNDDPTDTFPWEIGEWQLVSQKCASGRGHEEFSREECI